MPFTLNCSFNESMSCWRNAGVVLATASQLPDWF